MQLHDDRTFIGREHTAEATPPNAPSRGRTSGESPKSTPSHCLAWIETQTGERFPLGIESSLGRADSNQIVLPHEKVSRRHALIQTSVPGEFALSDLGSSNGTCVNGHRLHESAPIFDLDRIQIGPFNLLFRNPAGRPRPRPAGATPDSHAAVPPLTQPPVMRWLLLATFTPSAATSLASDNESPAARRNRWLDACRDLIEQRGGAISRYIGDGFLASWQDRTGTQTAVAHGLREITTLMSSLGEGPRLTLHYGPTEPTGTTLLGTASSAGSGVSFVFRMDRLAQAEDRSMLISAAAQQKLPDNYPTRSVGNRSLPAYEGEFEFFTPAAMGSETGQ